jgi:serine/threonine protein kinase
VIHGRRRLIASSSTLLHPRGLLVPEPSLRLGPLQLIRVLGEGGQGSVWLASDTRNARTVAVKLIDREHSRGDSLARIRREAKLLHTILDPGLPAGLDFLFDQPSGTLGIVMDYVEGITLNDLRCKRRLTPREIWAVAKEVARVAAVLHASGIVHRDIKMANIVLRPGWENGTAGSIVLVDLGIARGTGAHATAYTTPGTMVGSLPFSPPEILLGASQVAPDPTADVYAIGVLIWFLVFSRHPTGLKFDADAVDLVRAYRAGANPNPDPHTAQTVERELPGLIGVAFKCLHHSASLRYQNGTELYEAMAPLIGSRGPIPHIAAASIVSSPPGATAFPEPSFHPPIAQGSRPPADTVDMPAAHVLPVPVGAKSPASADASSSVPHPAVATGPASDAASIANRSVECDTVDMPTLAKQRGAIVAADGAAAQASTASEPDPHARPMTLWSVGWVSALALCVGVAVGLALGFAFQRRALPSFLSYPASDSVAVLSCALCPYGVSCVHNACSGRLDPKAVWSARTLALVQESSGPVRAFPGPGERLCVTVLRTNESCCATHPQPPCSLRVETSDLTSLGAGLHVELWNSASTRVIDATGVRSRQDSLEAMLAPQTLSGGEIRSGASMQWKSLAVLLNKPE